MSTLRKEKKRRDLKNIIGKNKQATLSTSIPPLSGPSLCDLIVPHPKPFPFLTEALDNSNDIDLVPSSVDKNE